MNNTRYIRLRKKICEEKKSMINVVFNLFDEDKDGFIDYQELKSALKALGFPTKKAEVLKILETYDVKAQKYLSSDDFKTVVIDKIMRCDPIMDIKYAFKLMCGDSKGGITNRELKQTLELVGVELNADEIESMIKEFDKDGDASINEEEFISIMLDDEEL